MTKCIIPQAHADGGMLCFTDTCAIFAFDAAAGTTRELLRPSKDDPIIAVELRNGELAYATAGKMLHFRGREFVLPAKVVQLDLEDEKCDLINRETTINEKHENTTLALLLRNGDFMQLELDTMEFRPVLFGRSVSLVARCGEHISDRDGVVCKFAMDDPSLLLGIATVSGFIYEVNNGLCCGENGVFNADTGRALLE